MFLMVLPSLQVDPQCCVQRGTSAAGRMTPMATTLSELPQYFLLLPAGR
jgi:hypothetical protein